jgi:glucose-like phosphotransferase system IIB component
VNPEALLTALGGRTNIRAVEAASTRLRVSVSDTSAVDQNAIRSLGLRGLAVLAPNCVHVLVGPAANEACTSLRQLLA